MNKLIAIAATASAFAIAPAASAATFVPGDPNFIVFGDGTTGTDPVSAIFGNGGLNGSATDVFAFQIGPETGEFIGLGSGSIATSFSTGTMTSLIFNSVIFNNGVMDFVIPIMMGEGSVSNIPVFSGNLNTLTVDYTARGNASYGGNLTFVPTEAVGAVPEPMTWMMMILGFAAIGFSVRRNKEAKVRVRYAF